MQGFFQLSEGCRGGQHNTTATDQAAGGPHAKRWQGKAAAAAVAAAPPARTSAPGVAPPCCLRMNSSISCVPLLRWLSGGVLQGRGQ